MTTYLLTWNPEKFALGGDQTVEPGVEIRWSCQSRQPVVGDTVVLMRLGVEPRGLIARGTVTRPSFEDADWKDPNATRNYIMIRLDDYRPDCASGLLPILLLQLALPDQRWNPQSSGIRVADDVATRLDALWRQGAGRNSLQQYVTWSAADPKESRPRWLAGYRALDALVTGLRSGETPLDTDAMERLWLQRSNGVTDVGNGCLSRSNFEDNFAWLESLTRRILERPDADTLAEVVHEWQAAVSEKRMARMNQVVIRRMFVAAAPDTFTTILQTDDCRRVLAVLREQFQVSVSGPAPDHDDWAALNASVVACMKAAGLDPERRLENNIAMWQIVETFRQPQQVENDMGDTLQTEGAPSPGAQNGPLNRILYGPPGTGKTFRVVEEAMRILSPELFADGPPDRETVLKPAFDRFVGNGQIVFTTFHQSFSYEDFVEGIRASTGDDGQLRYSVVPGVFKELCERARRGLSADEDPFERALATLAARARETEDGLLELRTAKGKRFRVRYEGKPTFLVYPESSVDLQSGYTASMRHVRTLYETGDASNIYNVSYVRGMLAYLQEHCGLPTGAPTVASGGGAKPFVMIIDEINRGNVSRIFGELITLIEESKRAGRREALEIVLPYSKDEEPPFSVPDNVYLIGTMNTADRSLAGLDIALRRRFSFVEMPPRPELLDGVLVDEVDIGKLLRAMNARIEVLLDRDHCLGHAYFMPLNKEPTLTRLAEIFRANILPLLQEYFFEDWQRIQWVLNDHRKPADVRFLRAPENDVAALFGPDANINAAAQRWTIDEAAFGRIEAYAGIIAA